ncbi:uncharacterized protein AMSG_09306 [Thecamonas trahens ATCC 50062]|uniref:Uncharacterized protein n=1 Tax=Thecamonas trahens ATCC 50062 TaxID=461836 RepID=A0A0L0DLN3_THETB|nr:hypothetical protein AMSG_09306 [Thecamonas trahens ATCC 50062]KNC53219.1 hypothetical protein AMSG_09306 [Thecamonas trahens ATCC 50062]|eukprot:XP_013754688.1 hypothetical protein AMSG_09306 [Thecamonas trahens ATCC 50062]
MENRDTRMQSVFGGAQHTYAELRVLAASLQLARKSFGNFVASTLVAAEGI